MKKVEIPKPADIINCQDGSRYRIYSTDDYFYYVQETFYGAEIKEVYKLHDEGSKTCTFVLPDFKIKQSPVSLIEKTGNYKLKRDAFKYENGQNLTLVVPSSSDLMLECNFAGQQTMYGEDHFPKEDRTVTLILPKEKTLYKVERTFSDYGEQLKEWWPLIADKLTNKEFCSNEVGEDHVVQQPVDEPIKFGNLTIQVSKNYYFEDGAVHETATEKREL